MTSLTLSPPRDRKIPVTVITGYLGSGKTTLLNHILSGQQGRKVAVIVNEFGEVGIDGQLIVQNDDEQLIEFNNGCLCCTVRGDLIETITKLQERAGELDAILIENHRPGRPGASGVDLLHFRRDSRVHAARLLCDGGRCDQPGEEPRAKR